MGRRVLPGRNVSQLLQQATEKVRRQQEECLASLRQLDQSMQRMVDQRGQSLLELAKHYLPKMSQESVLGSFEEIRTELLNVLVRKQRLVRELADELVEIEEGTAKRQAELEDVTERLDEKVAERERLEDVVVARLLEHEEFQRLSRQALRAEQELERDEDRVADIQAEAQSKLPSYKENRLFRYLVDRDFGKPEYAKKGWTRTFDRWVAKMIDYPRARRSYDFLCVTPELMAAEVTRRREQFNVLMDQVEAIEEEISDEVGLTEAMRLGQELGCQRDKLVADIDRLGERFSAVHKKLLELEGTQNKFYKQGVKQMKDFLAAMEHSWLEHQSRTTPEREDDELVAEIGWQNEQLDGAQRESGSLSKEQRTWDDRSAGLQDVLKRFRRAEFDSRRSQFAGGFDGERFVSDFLQGEIGREELWSAIRQYQQFAPTRRESSGWGSDDSRGSGDLSSVLGRVLIEVAGEALKHAVRHGMERRSRFRNKVRRHNGRLPFPFQGFTNGQGF